MKLRKLTDSELAAVEARLWAFDYINDWMKRPNIETEIFTSENRILWILKNCLCEETMNIFNTASKVKERKLMNVQIDQ